MSFLNQERLPVVFRNVLIFKKVKKKEPSFITMVLISGVIGLVLFL